MTSPARADDTDEFPVVEAPHPWADRDPLPSFPPPIEPVDWPPDTASWPAEVREWFRWHWREWRNMPPGTRDITALAVVLPLVLAACLVLGIGRLVS